jgi:hypothetical protein
MHLKYKFYKPLSFNNMITSLLGLIILSHKDNRSTHYPYKHSIKLHSCGHLFKPRNNNYQ